MKSRLALCSALTALAMLGCSGGGPSGGGSAPPPPPPPPPGSPALQVLPSTAFDFGVVTAANQALLAPLEVTIRNTGSAALSGLQIGLASPSASFAIVANAGTRPCGSAIAAGDYCNVRVAFAPPTQATGSQSYTASLQIASTNAGSFNLPISGTAAAVSSWSVRINQLDTACPSNTSTAYVSVLDQGGFPVLNLTRANFTVTQGNPPSNDLLGTVTYVEAAAKPIAIAAALDHSKSLTDQPVAFADMKTGFASMFESMGTSDQAAIVNFASQVEVVEPFTADKARLQTRLATPWDGGQYTRLYDAVHLAVNQAATKPTFRRAVVVATDGRDDGPTDPYSIQTLPAVIANAVANGVPIFTIGLGSDPNTAVLQQMATSTGGVYYEADTSQNLATIFRQLSTVLFQKQYVLTFDQRVMGSAGVVSPLTVSVLGGPSGTISAGTSITSCN